MEQEQEELKNYSKGYLTLPFDQDQFKHFISGLLGTPQTITRRLKGNFEVHLKDLQNFHDLINQRVTQQNNGKLLQLKTKIHYSDESSVLLSSYEELVTYNEVKPVVSEAVKMTWSYLIQFADKDVPEKQEIELMIIASPYREIIEDEDIPIFFPGMGEFRITIRHTARSWGSDIESLLTNQIKSLIHPCNKYKEYIKKKSTTIGVLVGILFLISALITIFFFTSDFNKTELVRVQLFLKQSTDVIQKTNYLINYIASNTQNIFTIKSELYAVVSIFLAILLGTWVGNLADIKVRSYLVLTRESLKKRDELEEKRKHKWLWFIASIVISIISGFIANILFKAFVGL
jgi:hypothetical protein